jgi:hypothetical protein
LTAHEVATVEGPSTTDEPTNSVLRVEERRSRELLCGGGRDVDEVVYILSPLCFERPAKNSAKSLAPAEWLGWELVIFPCFVGMRWI